MANFIKNITLIPIINLLIIALCLNLNIAAAIEEKKIHNKPPSYYCKQFQGVLQRVEKEYMGEVDYQKMTDEAIDGMLRSLDQYSGYYADDDLKFFLDHADGEFGGIGVEIMADHSVVRVISPIDDLPAHRAGIRAGDYIIGVNGKLVSDLGFNKSVREMRGKPGTKLNLLVVNEERSKTTEIELTREIVKIKPIKYELELGDYGGIGYIRIVTFNSQTIDELKKAVKSLTKQAKAKKKKLKGLILDVRNNPGGLLDQAVAVSEYFLSHGVIVSTKGKREKDNSIISAGRFVKKAPNIPMIMLVNSGSASASEIVAGALQDHGRAIILGTTSFGKGLIQAFAKINERSAIKFTVAKYYTPSGKSINGKGIKPDIFIENAKVEYVEKDNESDENSFSESSIKDYLKKHNSDIVSNKKNEVDKKIADKKIIEYKMSEKYKKDYQYARAYDLMRGLIIRENKH